jgi:hypothetical protein
MFDRKFLIASCLASAALISTPFQSPATAQPKKTWSERAQSVRNFFTDGKTSIRATYTPPKLPVSVSCTSDGTVYGSFNPKISSPLGSAGVSISRPITKVKCPKY